MRNIGTVWRARIKDHKYGPVENRKEDVEEYIMVGEDLENHPATILGKLLGTMSASRIPTNPDFVAWRRQLESVRKDI